MSRPTHAACRASLEPMGWVLRVSRPAPHCCCIRSLSKLCVGAGCRRSCDSLFCPDHGHRITYRRRSRLHRSPEPSPLLSLNLVSFRSLHFARPGLARNTTKGITDDSIKGLGA